MSIGFNPWNLIRSMKSVDQWGETVNANINGATRNAYKSSEVMFGGGNTTVVRQYNNGQAGLQVGETQVSIGYSRINWKQGDVLKTGVETNFAIQGRGFFAVADPRTTNWGANSGSGNALFFNGNKQGPDNPQQAYLTRDGDFHFAIVFDANNVNVAVARGISTNPSEPVLVNSEGLVVLSEYSNNSLAPVTYGSYVGANKVRPSVFEPSMDATGDANAPSDKLEYDQLKFSKYGSTIYEAPKANSFKTIVNGSAGVLDQRSSTDFADYQSKLIEKALEASNVNLEDEVGELSASKSFFEALTKNFLVYLDNTDSALRLFR